MKPFVIVVGEIYAIDRTPTFAEALQGMRNDRKTVHGI